MMAHYLVKVCVQTGEVSKIIVSIREANTPFEAGEMALLGNYTGSEEDGTMEWLDSGVADLNWDLHYSVAGCDLIDPADLPILQKYLS
tara:strand:- start:3880 stop:4143 length:264 start_codon:yes stop_codon:yes gene_type:complete